MASTEAHHHPLSLSRLLSNDGADPSEAAAAAAANGAAKSEDGGFVSRVAALPMVTSLTSLYEQTRSSSQLLRSVESSVMAVYRPIHGLVEPQLSSIDSFGCRQLDKLQANFPIVMERPDSMYESSKRYLQTAIDRQIDTALTVAETAVDRLLPPSEPMSQDSPAPSSPSAPSPSEPMGQDSVPSSPANGFLKSPDGTSMGRVHKIGAKVQNRIHRNTMSRLGSVVTKSQETINTMEMTATVIQGAQLQISDLTAKLRETLSQMQLFLESKAVGLTTLIQAQANETLRATAVVVQQIQKEIIDTLKAAIGTISKGASIMPAHVQTKIKDFLLALPSRWTAITSSIPSLSQGEQAFLVHGHQVVKFAEESAATLKSISDIFRKYIERAQIVLDTVKTASSVPSSPMDIGSPSPQDHAKAD